MPLIALVDGDRTVSLDLPAEAWDDLSKRRKSGKATVTLVGCEQPGFLRRSKHGLQHFVHATAGDCISHEQETPDHRAAKSVAYRAVIDAGWEAEVEVPDAPGPNSGWIADVLATREPVRVAVEIQWSRQDHDEFIRRQERYTGSGVRAVWFARHTDHLPAAPAEALPVFPLTKTGDEQYETTVNGQNLSLHDAVVALLDGRVRFRPYLTPAAQPQRIVNAYRYGCYKCGKECLIWNDEGETFTSRCGRTPHDLVGEDVPSLVELRWRSGVNSTQRFRRCRWPRLSRGERGAAGPRRVGASACSP